MGLNICTELGPWWGWGGWCYITWHKLRQKHVQQCCWRVKPSPTNYSAYRMLMPTFWELVRFYSVLILLESHSLRLLVNWRGEVWHLAPHRACRLAPSSQASTFAV